jgi:hypothetical protein
VTAKLITTDWLVRGLAAELDGVATSRLDTPQIMLALERLGATVNLDVYPETPLPKRLRKRNRACMWDMSWWQNDSRLVLACESELGHPGEVSFDFAKLLAAKAPWKLLITDAGATGHTTEALQETTDYKIKEHNDHRMCETYVWIDLQCDDEGGDLRAFEFTPNRFDCDQRHSSFCGVQGSTFKYYKDSS